MSARTAGRMTCKQQAALDAHAEQLRRIADRLRETANGLRWWYQKGLRMSKSALDVARELARRLSEDCNCEFDHDDDCTGDSEFTAGGKHRLCEGCDSYHYRRVCLSCGHVWWSLHCAHEAPRSCPRCLVVQSRDQAEPLIQLVLEQFAIDAEALNRHPSQSPASAGATSEDAE